MALPVVAQPHSTAIVGASKESADVFRSRTGPNPAAFILRIDIRIVHVLSGWTLHELSSDANRQLPLVIAGRLEAARSRYGGLVLDISFPHDDLVGGSLEAPRSQSVRFAKPLPGRAVKARVRAVPVLIRLDRSACVAQVRLGAVAKGPVV